MQIIREKQMKSIVVRDFNLQHSLECGQVFRWKREDNFYYGFIKNTPLKIKQEKERLIYDSFENKVREKDLAYYFNLNQDYKKIIGKINKDKVVGKAIENFYGLRIINQQPFECLVSYLCSSASNIPKINKNLDLIAERFGEEIIFDGRKFFAFPSIEQLSNAREEELDCCSVGFRKNYIAATPKKIQRENIDLDEFKKLNYAEAKKKLMFFSGVGGKIADCVCLYSLGFSQAFPVDIWMKRIMKRFYGKKEMEINEFALGYFGKNAGLAQQFLYYYFRTRD